jgi:hypothetical protein
LKDNIFINFLDLKENYSHDTNKSRRKLGFLGEPPPYSNDLSGIIVILSQKYTPRGCPDAEEEKTGAFTTR